MATRVDLLFPINTSSPGFDPAVMLSSINSGLIYNVAGYTKIVAQIDTPLDAALAGTITVQCSQTGNTWYDIPGGPTTYTAAGVQQAINIEGLRFVRYQFTATSGTVEVAMTLTGVLDV
jgi:hypothetical protein